MTPARRSLREEPDAGDDQDEQRRGRRIAAEREAAGIEWLVEKIPDDRAQRPRVEHERNPEQRRARNVRPEISQPRSPAAIR